ncbi:integrin alpha [Streptomyces koelreuteriae]|uniref:Integrin alpha n=1 Tax=Streptomyces koelreuteriae TaxID=2838015 RepID=A0ABX8G4B6_9ACTN|nr:integrin alpha [Streptomyces koelreuteriae]
MRQGRLLAATAGGFALAIGSLSVSSPPAAAATCATGTVSDFNGDGVADTVIADPNAAVNGAKAAGLVRIVLGGGKGVSEISQAMNGMGATPEAGDQFGFSRTSYDVNEDGCTDLVVGAPYEDVAKDGKQLVDAGAVYVIHGTPAGIGPGSKVEGYTQSELDPSTSTEAYDWFGHAVRAGSTASGSPYLVVGVPGENVTVGGTTHTDAGCVAYVQGATRVSVSQKDPGVPGDVEAHDRFGYSLAGTNRFFAVGAPGEAIGTAKFAGGVSVFSHAMAGGLPTPLVGLDQDGAGVAGTAEAGDGFGTSLSMTSYRPGDQTYNSDVLLAVGTPGEDVDKTADSGGAAVFRVQPSGTYTEVAAIDAADLGEAPAAGDFMGQRVTIANTNSAVVTTTATVRLAVGVPGRDTASAKDAGAVRILRPLDTAVSSTDKILVRGSGLPGKATTRDYNGTALTSGSAYLYLGVPHSKASDSPSGVLYVVPWTDIDGTTTVGTTTYLPGEGGLPDEGVAFGTVG